MTDCSNDISKTNGRWTKMEHEKFILGLQLYSKDWKKIQELIGTRNGAQIRSHAQKYFIKAKKEAGPNQCENQQASQHELASPVTQTSASPPPNENYSYFLSKIVGKFSNEEGFDFWSHLVDHKQNCVDNIKPLRKSSFITIGSQSSDYQRLIPTKKIKSQ